MDRFRSRRLAAGILVACAVLAAACGKKDEAGGGGGKGGAAAAGNKDLDVIPIESDIVLGVDLAQAQKSPVFQELVLPMITKSGEVQRIIELLKTKCNIDPMAAATGLTAGVKIVDNRNADLVAVLHGLEKAKAMACLDQMKDQLAEQKLEVAKDGDVVVLKSEDGDLAFKFTGDTTAVVVVGSKANKAGVEEAAQGKSQLKSSKEFTDMYGRAQVGHTIWYLVKGETDLIAKNLERINVKAKAIFGSVNLTDKLELRGHMRAETEEQATNVVDLLKTQAGVFGKMAEKVDIDRDKNDVKTTVVLTQAQIKTVAGFMGGLGRAFR